MDYSSNSHKSKELAEQKEEVPEKKIEKVVTHEVKVERSMIKRLASLFFETDIGTVKDYVVEDVFFPKLKELAYSVITDGLNMWFFQGKKPTGTRINNSGSVTPIRVSYNRCSDQSKPESSTVTPRVKPWFDPEEVKFEDYADARNVLDNLKDILEASDAVSVSEFADLANIDIKWTGVKFGWTSLKNVTIEQTSDGRWYLKMPRPKPI